MFILSGLISVHRQIHQAEPTAGLDGHCNYIFEASEKSRNTVSACLDATIKV